MVPENDIDLSRLLASSVGEGHPFGEKISEIVEAWRAGAEPDAASALATDEELAQCKPACLELIYAEFVFRKERGETLDTRVFLDRFPSLSRSLAELFSAIDFMKANLTNDGLIDQIRFRWPEVGEQIGPFRLESHLGAGGLARVYLAREVTAGDRRVVVKLSQYSTLEPHIQGRLNHPHIMPILSANPDPATELTPICMPFLGRATLQDLLDIRKRLPTLNRHGAAELLAACRHEDVEETAQTTDPSPTRNVSEWLALWGAQMAGALAHLHHEKFIHGDLKPANVLITAHGDARLIDFNLAADRTVPTARLGGTLPYMAPEQWSALAAGGGIAPDPSSDVFSLGVLLLEFFTGRHPFMRGSMDRPLDVLANGFLQTYRERLPELMARMPRHAPRLSAVIMACLAESPSDRPTAAAVERALTVRPRRHPAILTSVAVGLLILSTAALTVPLVPQREPEPLPVLPETERELTAAEQADAHLENALQFAAGQKFQDACDEVEKADALVPVTGKWWARLTYWCRDNPRKAIDYARLAKRLKQDTPVVRSNEAYHSLQYFHIRGDLARLGIAERELTKLIESDPPPPPRVLIAARYNRMLTGLLRYCKKGDASHHREQLAGDADALLISPDLTIEGVHDVALFYAAWAFFAKQLSPEDEKRARDQIAVCYAIACEKDRRIADKLKDDPTIAKLLPKEPDSALVRQIGATPIRLLDPMEFE